MELGWMHEKRWKVLFAPRLSRDEVLLFLREGDTAATCVVGEGRVRGENEEKGRGEGRQVMGE